MLTVPGWHQPNNPKVLVSDGGVFARVHPRAPGGRWVSLNGDIKEMEYLSAHYDNRADRFIAGAQVCLFVVPFAF